MGQRASAQPLGVADVGRAVESPATMYPDGSTLPSQHQLRLGAYSATEFGRYFGCQ